MSGRRPRLPVDSHGRLSDWPSNMAPRCDQEGEFSGVRPLSGMAVHQVLENLSRYELE